MQFVNVNRKRVMPTYRNMLTEAMKSHSETWDDVEQVNILPNHYHWSDGAHYNYDHLLDEEIDTGYGGVYGPSVTLWTHKRVYFGACYDGLEWIESVPRYPCNEVVYHIGGG